MAKRKPGHRTAKGRLSRAEAMLAAVSESFGEFASMCFAGGRHGSEAD